MKTLTNPTASFTPGPWETYPISLNSPTTVGIRSKELYSMPSRTGPRDYRYPQVAESYDEANARLIASAPDLLAALEAMMPIFDAFTQDELSVTTIDEAAALLPQARAAIAKAKGL